MLILSYLFHMLGCSLHVMVFVCVIFGSLQLKGWFCRESVIAFRWWCRDYWGFILEHEMRPSQRHWSEEVTAQCLCGWTISPLIECCVAKTSVKWFWPPLPPARLGIDEVEAVKVLISNMKREQQAKLEAIARKRRGKYWNSLISRTRTACSTIWFRELPISFLWVQI